MQEEQVLNLIRHLRHDFGNCLQVVQSCIEIDRPRDGKAVIEEWVEQKRREKIIFDLPDAELAVHLYQTMVSAREIGLRVVYDEVQIGVSAFCQARGEPLAALRELFRSRWQNLAEPTVHVTLQENDGRVMMRFVISGEDYDLQEYLSEEM
jgi:sensor histidine kinase regulating citrate/malate metabolism